MIFALYALTVIVTGVALALVAGYRLAYPALSYHVRLAIEIDDHGDRKTGASVVEIRETPYPSFGGLFGGGLQISSHGEAVFLDLGDGRNLFALLGLGGFCCGGSDDIFRIVDRTFFVGANQGAEQYGPRADVERVLAANMAKPVELPPDRMPTLARFRDLADPKTIEEVSPADLAKSCGPGVKFLRATIEITDAPVMTGVIEKRLPWLRAMIGDDPIDHLPIYCGFRPELEQPRIFFVGFVRS